ncbi:MAG: lactate racemase domain-containing protein [Actinobacteria bacterium]|nr:lactate racemase domain-containing protein [Actinomycetota bacterium]
MQQQIVFGDSFVTAEVPDDTRVISAGLSVPLEPVADLEAAVREAVERPLDTPPLREMARGKRTVTVAFDDATVPCYAPLWTPALGVILGELAAAGVPRRGITLVCANSLHRQFTHDELAKLIGEDLVREWSGQLECHDAEDPSMLEHLGQTASGYHVELSRRVTDADLVVYLNCSTTRGFSGGWKSICVGLSTYRSIKHHHNPDDMSMSVDGNRMHDMLDQMGALTIDKLGADRFFKIETVLANPLQVARIFGGSVDACRREVLQILRAKQPARRTLLDQKADVVLYGVPDWSPYAAFSHTNPILTLVSTALGYLGGLIEAVGKRGCSVVLATPAKDRWDQVHHPSYKEVWDRVLPETRDPYEAMHRYSEEYANREDYIQQYRTEFGFHPVHGVMALYPLKRLKHASQIYVAGAEDPGVVRHVGFEPADTVEAALAAAMEPHGPEATVALVPYPPAVNRQ